MTTNSNPHADLRYEDFRRLAERPDLSRHEKVGFPNNYREGKEEQIYRDMETKLKALNETCKTVLEIGPGCSNLPIMLAESCRKKGSRVLFVDSSEMLAQLPDGPHITKYPGTFPDALSLHASELTGKINAVIAYSVLQYVFAEFNLWNFLDTSLALLANGGEALIGDIPNISMRKRFFCSPSGEETHRQHTGLTSKPEVKFNIIDPGQIDDSVVMAILSRARAQGYHAWVLPQSTDLPMANRREDILIRKP
jgi:hypothetical protein